MYLHFTAENIGFAYLQWELPAQPLLIATMIHTRYGMMGFVIMHEHSLAPRRS
jgi:hypothetical protein